MLPAQAVDRILHQIIMDECTVVTTDNDSFLVGGMRVGEHRMRIRHHHRRVMDRTIKDLVVGRLHLPHPCRMDLIINDREVGTMHLPRPCRMDLIINDREVGIMQEAGTAMDETIPCRLILWWVLPFRKQDLRVPLIPVDPDRDIGEIQ
jgi:hypothetical protein